MAPTDEISTRDLGFGRSKFHPGCSRRLYLAMILVLCGYMVYREDLHLTTQYQHLSMTTTSKISKGPTLISFNEVESMHAHQARKTVPEVLVLITPAGGLTNVKQRLFGALCSSREKYANKNVQFTIPWVPVAPIIGPLVPLDSIFNITTFLNWMAVSGFSFFNDSHILHEKRDGWYGDWNSYFKIMSDWAVSSNVTLVREVGALVPIETSYGVGAFHVKDDLLHQSGVTGNILDGCVVHARVESDWQHYSGGIYFVPLLDILSSIYASKMCEDKNLTVLTGSASEVKQICPSCFLSNKTSLNYIQAAAIDFHIGIYSRYFAGHMQSSLSRLIMLSKGYNGTFTYSKLDGHICLRKVVTPQQNKSADHGLLAGLVKSQCLTNGTQ